VNVTGTPVSTEAALEASVVVDKDKSTICGGSRVPLAGRFAASPE
jgi:hypothetical protein